MVSSMLASSRAHCKEYLTSYHSFLVPLIFLGDCWWWRKSTTPLFMGVVHEYSVKMRSCYLVEPLISPAKAEPLDSVLNAVKYIIQSRHVRQLSLTFAIWFPDGVSPLQILMVHGLERPSLSFSFKGSQTLPVAISIKKRTINDFFDLFSTCRAVISKLMHDWECVEIEIASFEESQSTVTSLDLEFPTGMEEQFWKEGNRSENGREGDRKWKERRMIEK